MAEADSRQIEADWWADWHRANFSWEGLNQHYWPGWGITEDGFAVHRQSCRRYGLSAEPDHTPIIRSATLQDYWRADPATGRVRADKAMGSELIRRSPSYTGSTANHREVYHRVHLPLAYADQEATVKGGWAADALDSLVEPRLRAAAVEPDARDYRAILDGGVWLSAPPSPDSAPIAASFSRSAFVREASFAGAAFLSRTSFRETLFLADAQFGSAEFAAKVSFGSAIFLGAAEFGGVRFADEAWFYDARFLGAVRFQGLVAKAATFANAIFASDVSFHEGQLESCSFANAKFRGRSDFTHAALGAAVFDTARFDDLARLDYAKFDAMRFRGAEFKRQASFRHLTWPVNERDRRSAFGQTLFAGPLVLEGSGCHVFSAFDGARLERGLAMDREPERGIDIQFYRELDAAADLHAGENRDSGLAALENGCRVLKQAAALQSDKSREQMFYRYELVARRRQDATPRSEWAFSWAYYVISNYGASIGRPVLGLIATILGFATLYWALKQEFGAVGGAIAAIPGGRALDPRLLEALSFSFSRVFPFGAFEFVSRNWIEQFTPGVDDPATFGIRILASFESMIAVALVFVLGLAVRRKFQIS